ncbi:MAG: glycosyltransferase family 4 protein, partial [Acidimicrobiales bacterium]
LVVAHGGESLKYATAAGVDSPLVYHKIGVLNSAFERPASRILHRAAVARAHAVVAISEAARREAIDRLGVHPSSISVIPNARDPEKFWPSPRCNSIPLLTFVGHLGRSKRPNWLVEAASELRSRGHEFEAVIAGSGPLLGELRREARSAGVALIGHVDDVADLLRRTDVLAFPSMPFEGMPGVLIEAAMSGAACVTTDVPGASDVVMHGETGLIVPPDRFDLFVDSIEQLIVDPERSVRFGHAARSTAVERFHPRRIATAWESLCHHILEESPCACST